MHVTAGRTLKMRIKSARLGVMRVNLGAGVEVAAERGTKQCDGLGKVTMLTMVMVMLLLRKRSRGQPILSV